ncbi:MAG: hypothetical protein HQ589_06935, partial [Syntrophaceae bacterium]|nr:hypothetical protein [Syntrophaceae bacterium]
MKAIIFPSAIAHAFQPLIDSIAEYLLPVVNKPVLEHLIELLVRHGIDDICVVLEHMPYETRQYFSEGERWGARISYLLEGDYEGIIPTMNRIRGAIEGDSLLCLPGNMVSNLDISAFIGAHSSHGGDVTLWAKSEGEAVTAPLKAADGDNNSFFMPFIVNRGVLPLLLSGETPRNMTGLIKTLESQNVTSWCYHSPQECTLLTSLTDLWEVNRDVLNGRYEGIIIPERETEKNVRVGRRSTIHPTVKMHPPVLVGKNCSIGEGAVIGEEVIIGDNVVIGDGALVKRSVILSGTFVGSHTEIENSLIRKHDMINARTLESVYVEDDIILGDLDREIIGGKGDRLYNLAAAMILLIALMPLMLVLFFRHVISPSRKYFYSEKRLGEREIVDLKGMKRPRAFTLFAFRSRIGLYRKIPGLFNVIREDMNLVGNSPLTAKEADSLQEEWETLR